MIDRENALVALMAAIIAGDGTAPIAAAERALELLEAAEEKVNERRGLERSVEELEAAAHQVVDRWRNGSPKGALSDVLLGRLERALKNLRGGTF